MVGIKRKIVQFITKVIPIFEYHVCTNYEISEKFYESQLEPLAGIR